MLRCSWKIACAAMLMNGVLVAESGSPPAWPDWRGPGLNRSSEADGLPIEWDNEKNIVWRTPLPARSGATPIIAGGLVLLNVGDKEKLELWAVDQATGVVRWSRALGEGNERKHKQNMSSPSPVTDGQRVWVLTGTGVLKSFELSGKELWARDLPADYGPFGLNWGYAASPLLHEGVLYVQVLHGMRTDEPSYVLAIDGSTGQTQWRVERPTDAQMESPDSYTTPALLQRGPGELVISGGDYVTGHALVDGKELWRVGGLNPERRGMYRIVASPVVVGSRIFVPSRVRPLLALEADMKKVGEQPANSWSFDRGPDVPTPAANADSVFVLTDRGILRRLDAITGEDTWGGPQRLTQGAYTASPLLADGRVYATSEDGTTTVVSADGKFEVLAVNKIDGYTLSSLAVADGAIFMRTEEALYSIRDARRRSTESLVEQRVAGVQEP